MHHFHQLYFRDLSVPSNLSRVNIEKQRLDLFSKPGIQRPAITPAVVQIIGDNESVMKSSSIPKVELKKKWVALSYHRLRECTAADIIAGRWIPGLENKSNLLTKSLNGPQLLKE